LTGDLRGLCFCIIIYFGLPCGICAMENVMNLKNYLVLDDYQLRRFEEMYERYKLLYNDPGNCSPMFIIDGPVEDPPPWEERLEDPLLMLKAHIDMLRPHLEIEDDRVPTARVEFGTAQVAAAFGCRLAVPTNSLPAAADHALKSARDVYEMDKPSLDAGWYGKLKKYTEIYLENLPEGMHIQHPDIQSAFNSAHLIRGNDILTDFFDDPEAVCALLDLVTDYMIDMVPHLKGMISAEEEWFFDWSAFWKGAARISNCSMHMISPEFFREFVLPRDMRLMKAVGGGRIHYCGTSGEVITEFFKNPEVTGLDYDSAYHSLWELSEIAPEKVTLLAPMSPDSEELRRLMAGDWPKKRNLIIKTSACSIEEAKELLQKLRRSVPDGVN